MKGNPQASMLVIDDEVSIRKNRRIYLEDPSGALTRSIHRHDGMAHPSIIG